MSSSNDSVGCVVSLLSPSREADMSTVPIIESESTSDSVEIVDTEASIFYCDVREITCVVKPN